jgi:hypothetical protein
VLGAHGVDVAVQRACRQLNQTSREGVSRSICSAVSAVAWILQIKVSMTPASVPAGN